MVRKTNKEACIAKLAEHGFEMVNPDLFETSNTVMEIRCNQHGLIWKGSVGNAYRKAKYCKLCRLHAGNWKQHAEQKKYTILENDGEYAVFQCEYMHTPWKTQVNHIKFTECKECSGTKIHIDKIVEKIRERGFTLMNPGDIKTTNSKGVFKCAFEHEWSCNVHNVYDGKSGCPTCSQSKGEKRCRFILEKILNKPFPKTREVVIIDGKKLELDMYNAELSLALEYNGIQHYVEHEKHFHKGGGFEEQLVRDIAKYEFCESNGINLIVVKYELLRFEEVASYIVDKLVELGYISACDLDWTELEIEFNTAVDNNKLTSNMENEKYTAIANEKNAQFVSKGVENGFNVLKFICDKGHSFSIRPGDVNRGRWCSQCRGRFKLSNDSISERLAEIKMQVVTPYVNSYTAFTVSCNECDSSYDSNWDNLVQREMSYGSCRFCKDTKAWKLRNSDTLNRLTLSLRDKLFVDAKHKHTWGCSSGHEQVATWNALKIRKTGCKLCNPTANMLKKMGKV